MSIVALFGAFPGFRAHHPLEGLYIPQFIANLEQVIKPEQEVVLVQVFLNTPVSDLGVVPLAFDDLKGMLNLGPETGESFVPLSLNVS